MRKRNIEELRYDSRAKDRLYSSNFDSVNKLNQALKAPYILYEARILERVSKSSSVLEIGAGMGENTGFLLGSGAKICATDVSKYSLDIIQKRFDNNRLTTKVADMEKLPFDEGSFDLVCCAGSLSYGDNLKVMNEIYRVLKKGGVMVAVDSLNNNPIYRFNRYVHYLKGNRSLSVIKRTPDLELLTKYKYKFGRIEAQFFGAISYLMPLLNAMFGGGVATKISDRIDALIGVKRSAFKFVIVVEKQ